MHPVHKARISSIGIEGGLGKNNFENLRELHLLMIEVVRE